MEFIEVENKHKEKYEAFVNNQFESTCMQMWQWAEFRNQLSPNLYNRLGIIDKEGNFHLTASYAINRFKYIGNILYIPQGPIWRSAEALKLFEEKIVDFARRKNCIAVICDPRVKKDDGKFKDLEKVNFLFTDEAVQPRVTIFLDLSKSEDEILQSFSKNTRYNIRYALRKGIKIKKFSEPKDASRIVGFYELLLSTQKRKYFYVQPIEYFESLWDTFSREGRITLFEAFYKDSHLGSILLINTDKFAISLFSASSPQYSNLKPLYLMRWESIKEAKLRGCKFYDFFGATDSQDESHPFFYTTQHKLGFSKDFQKFAGTFEIVLNPLKYKMWRFMEDMGIFKFYEKTFIRQFRERNVNKKN
ncbi:peptidoglycan bridge formation glycyltransferase FemA/FemB family protein [Candidatus Dojkabacteria bacterium]|nr:peptidoglycan bridge formation glycyltransferase FemA/FemB family protein [Candidatus Dojkabacteria bacterium]